MKRIVEFLERIRYRKSLERNICDHDCTECEYYDQCVEDNASHEDFVYITKSEFYFEVFLAVTALVLFLSWSIFTFVESVGLL